MLQPVAFSWLLCICHHLIECSSPELLHIKIKVSALIRYPCILSQGMVNSGLFFFLFDQMGYV